MFTSKLNKIVLCATAKNLVAGLWHADKLQRSELFINNEAGHLAFANFLNDYPTTHVYLIANAVEEDYRLERLPHSGGNAKRELIARKLNQFYRGLDYRTAHFINREKDKRKDDKFLFVALNNDDFLQDWMQVIQSSDALLVGVYLLPMLSQRFVSEFKLSAPHILLCERLSSGIRQTYLHNGRLRMSRLIPNVPTDPKQLGYFYIVETQKTRLYLMSKRFISRDVMLNLQLISTHGEMEQIKKTFDQEPGIECEIIPLAKLAKSHHLSTTILDTMPELLHMQLLASGNLVDNLAPSALTKAYRLSKIGRWIKTIALITGIIGIIISAWYLMSGLNHQRAFKDAKQATRLEQLRYQEVAKSFPETEISAQDLKTAVSIDQTISNFSKSPKRMMFAISHALTKNPNIHLVKLNWLQSNDPTIKDTDSPNIVTSQSAAVNLQNVPADPSKLLEISFMTADISQFDGDYRSAMRAVNSFVTDLKNYQDVANVEVLQTPVNLNSYTDLTGNTKDAQLLNLNQAATFKVKVILKSPTEAIKP